jgi:hypothetical protein|tara:strand:+ start:366 stop:560 length:195 start_codon:yes stop_codon:yes gene_type:complete
MICNECNSEPFQVIVKEELGYEHEAIELGLDVTNCPFCGANLEWASRGGYDAGEYDNDEDRLES